MIDLLIIIGHWIGMSFATVLLMFLMIFMLVGLAMGPSVLVLRMIEPAPTFIKILICLILVPLGIAVNFTLWQYFAGVI
jgi:hypothetical protein